MVTVLLVLVLVVVVVVVGLVEMVMVMVMVMVLVLVLMLGRDDNLVLYIPANSTNISRRESPAGFPFSMRILHGSFFFFQSHTRSRSMVDSLFPYIDYRLL